MLSLLWSCLVTTDDDSHPSVCYNQQTFQDKNLWPTLNKTPKIYLYVDCGIKEWIGIKLILL